MIRLRIAPADHITTRVFAVGADGAEVEISGFVRAVRWEHRSGELATCTLELLAFNDEGHALSFEPDMVAAGHVITATVGAPDGSALGPVAARDWVERTLRDDGDLVDVTAVSDRARRLVPSKHPWPGARP